MVKTNYNSTEDMNIKLQELKGKTKLNFYKNISNYFDILNIKVDEDTFGNNAQGFSKIYHELLLLMKFLQTKPQVKDMNIKSSDLFILLLKTEMKKKMWIISNVMKMNISHLMILFHLIFVLGEKILLKW